MTRRLKSYAAARPLPNEMARRNFRHAQSTDVGCGRKLIFYSNKEVPCPESQRSGRSASKLAAEGFKVLNFKGSILAWCGAKYPWVTPAGKPTNRVHTYNTTLCFEDAMTNCWVSEAIRAIEADFNRSTDTHLIKVPLPCCADVDLYLKDESIHPSGSLKHRLARSLFLYAICNGWIREGTPVIEASSGSTAISEAYFAQLLGLPFYTVIPSTTSREKIHKIEFLGGKCRLVDSTEVELAACELARQLGGHYMDQFTYAERATDWRGNNNIADSLFRQMSCERYPEPTWVVMSAGTGGTSATIGRYIRYQKLSTKLCVVDPDNSVFFDYYRSGDSTLRSSHAPRIEGIGRPRVEPSFIPSVVDRMLHVPDAASIAAIDLLKKLIDRRCGGSTGTNLFGAIHLMGEMKARGERGSVVTVICDGGERYQDTYYKQEWRDRECPDVKLFADHLADFMATGTASLEIRDLQIDSRRGHRS